MRRRALVVGIAVSSLGCFAAGAIVYRSTTTAAARDAAKPIEGVLFRAHAPVFGPIDAIVTITEFFDPSCEACRAFYPIVKQIMDMHPGKVRLVLRYAALHEGSDEAVRILEAARLQYKFTPVLEALLARQPEWAMHDGPSLEKAWEIAATAGLSVEMGRRQAASEEVTAVLQQDAADLETVGVKQTPTFFVNGKPLTEFGPQQLYDLVTSEVQAAES